MMRSGEFHHLKNAARTGSKPSVAWTRLRCLPHDPFARKIDQAPVQVSGPTGCPARKGEPGHDGRGGNAGDQPRLEDNRRQGRFPHLLHEPGGDDPRACNEHGILVA